MIPFFCVATVGTTGTTAIDPIKSIATICNNEKLWLHIDAAYAGSACICPEFRSLLDGVELADSFTMNPHKWLMTTFDCSAFWIKNRIELINSMSVIPEYLRNNMTDTGQFIQT